MSGGRGFNNPSSVGVSGRSAKLATQLATVKHPLTWGYWLGWQVWGVLAIVAYIRVSLLVISDEGVFLF